MATKDSAASAPETTAAADLWKAEYIGSGTFLIKKPKRKSNKLHQQRVRSSKPGMRK